MGQKCMVLGGGEGGRDLSWTPGDDDGANLEQFGGSRVSVQGEPGCGGRGLGLRSVKSEFLLSKNPLTWR